MLNMNFALVESRKVWRWYLPLLGAMTLYVLLRPQPLSLGDIRLTTLASIQGLLLAFRVFHDPAGTQSFMWSRPMTRKQLFLNRWLLGLFFQALTVLVLAALIISGARLGVQKALWHNPFYPASYLYDLNVLYPCIINSLLVYHVAFYLKAFAEINWGKSDTYRGGIFRAGVIIFISLCAPLLLALHTGLPPFVPPEMMFWKRPALVVIIASVLAATGAYIYAKLEVES